MLREANPEKERCGSEGPLGKRCHREKGHDGMCCVMSGPHTTSYWAIGTDPSPTITANVSHMAKQIRQAAAEDDRYKKWRESRRLRAVRIDEQRVLSAVLFSTERLPRWILKYKHPAVPDGALVHAAFHDFMARSFVFHLWHQSFDPVEEGGIVPWIDGFVPSELQVEAVELPPWPIPEPPNPWPVDTDGYPMRISKVAPDTATSRDMRWASAYTAAMNAVKPGEFDGSTGLPDEPTIRIGERSPPNSVQ